MFKEYTNYDAMGLAELIRTRQVSASEVLEAAMAQIEAINPKINAVVYKMYEQARAELKTSSKESPFFGVPFLIKDLGVTVRGAPTSIGSRLSSDALAEEDSEIVARYRRAGLITLGKTNVPEFGIMGVTESLRWGPCRNPWNTALTPGGSSGGSAAAVAARMVPMASADDGGGSIRIPASACGLFGFKPSRGVQPIGPDRNESWLGLVSGHIVSRSVRDSASLLELTKGPLQGAAYGPTKSVGGLSEALTRSVRGRRVAFSKQSLLGHQTDRDCLVALEETMRECERLGMIVNEDQPRINKEELVFSYYVIVAACVAGEVARLEKTSGRKANFETVEQATWFLKVAGEKLRAAHLEKAIFVARQATIQWESFLDKYDYFSTPTMAYTPSPIGLMDMSAVEEFGVHLAEYLPLNLILNILGTIGARGLEKTPNTPIFNMTGHPAMSVPTYWNQENTPVGVQFVGRMSEDAELFSLARALEEARPWGHRRPV